MRIEQTKLIDQFIRFEAVHNFFDLEIQGIKIWPYLRFSIYRSVKKELWGLAEANYSENGSNKLRRIIGIFLQLPDMVFKNPLFCLKQKDVIVFNSPRRIKNGAYYDCIYTDKLLSHLLHSYYVFEDLYQGGNYKPIRTEPLRYLDYINLVNAVFVRIYRLKGLYNLTEQEKMATKNLIEQLNECFKVNLCYENYIKIIQNLIYSYYLNKKAFEHILNKVKPKLFIQVCYYGFKCMLMNELAKQRGIKTIELQHGTMGRGHVAYNFYKRTSLGSFPDHLFLFGDYWKDVTRFPLKENRVHVTGSPYYEAKIKDAINVSSAEGTHPKVILFVSQWSTGDKLSKIAVELSNLIQSSRFRIIYKLHPREYNNWLDKYPWLVGSSQIIEVVCDNSRDIYYYLNLSDYQIGVNSTTLYEGLGFNLKTIIVKLPGWETLEDLVNADIAKLVSSASELAGMLEYYESNIVKMDRNEINDYFWKQDAIYNMLKAINETLRE